MIDIARCLEKIRPGEQWSINANTYDGLVWLDTTAKPTMAEIEAAWAGVQAEIIKNGLITAAQSHMDSTAQSSGYDDIKTACTYADEPAVPKFQAEGQAFRAWRSLVWAYCYAQLDAVTAGERMVPTADVLIGELPKLGAEV